MSSIRSKHRSPSRPRGPLDVAEALEDASALDHLVDVVIRLSTIVVPSQERVHDELRGRSMGHPVHAVLTDVPLGLWMGAVTLDLTGPGRHAEASRRLVGLGLLAAVPTVVAGLADFPALSHGARRAAATHAVVNGVGNALFAASWLARRKDRQSLGIVLSLAALGAAGAGGFLGGHVAGRLHEPPPLPR